MSDIIRVLRVLEYIGPREWVERTLSNNGVPANGEHRMGGAVIKSAVLGQFPEILDQAEKEDS